MKDSNGQLQCLLFRINKDSILALIDQIQVVLPLPNLQSIPHEDEAFEGLLNFHTRSVPIYHLASLLGLKKPDYDLNTPIIICNLSTGLIGLLVSEVVEIRSLEKASLQSQPLKSPLPYVIGIWKEKQAKAWLLDIEKLLNWHQQQEARP